MLSEVLKGLQHAHDNGLVHRDVKPGNIMLHPDGIPKLTDFGLSFEVGSLDIYSDSEERLLGTPAYMSPEQVRSGPPTCDRICSAWVSCSMRWSPA